MMPVDTKIEYDCNFIKETVCKIDKLQKEVVTVGEVRCISCEASLLTAANNTIPVSFFSDCGEYFLGHTDLSSTTTYFFRIESVRCNRYATLRLLTYDAETQTLTATDRTMILDLDKVAGMQCYEAITVEICTNNI